MNGSATTMPLRVEALPADEPVRCWMAALERSTFRDPFSIRELTTLQDIERARLWVFYDPRSPIRISTRLGYLIGMHRPSRFEIHRLVVAADWRGEGYGREMLDWLAVYCRRQGQPRMLASLGERQLECHHFFSACGFSACAAIYTRRRSFYQFERGVDGRRAGEFAVFRHG